MKLVDLKRSKKEQKSMDICKPSSSDSYGYGTRMSMEKEQVDKLFGDTLPKVGDTYTGEFVATITSVSQNSSSGYDGDSARVEMQFKNIGVEKQAKSALAAVSKAIDEAS